LAVTRLTALREKNSGSLGPADLLLKKAVEAAKTFRTEFIPEAEALLQTL
jgi:hypothetical protein